MKIEIQRTESSTPIIYEGAEDAYTKGPLYCILYQVDGLRVVHKHPLCGIFRIIEEYEGSNR